MTDPAPHHVERLRAFNRFHTRLVGALKDDHLQSRLPLPQVRVLWELGSDGPLTAAALGARLALDKGYMSRLVSTLTEGGLITPPPIAMTTLRRSAPLRRRQRQSCRRRCPHPAPAS